MRRLALAFRLASPVIGLVWCACSAGPSPEALMSEGQRLQGEYDEHASRAAIANYRGAAALWIRQGAMESAARAWQGVGDAYWQLGALDASRSAYESALSLARLSMNRRLESDLRGSLGVAQAYAAGGAHQLKLARDQCDRAMVLAQQARSSEATAKALICLGEVAYFNQDVERALTFFREADRRFEALGSEAGHARAQLLQGHVLSDLGRLEPAEACVERARIVWSRHGDRRELAIAHVAEARLEVRRGNYQAALNSFNEGLELLDPMGDAVWKGSALTGIGRVYLDMGDPVLALTHWERALQLFEEAGLRIFAVDVLMSLGSTYLDAGNHTVALSRFDRALTLAGELRVDRWKAWALRFIGVVHLDNRRADLARDVFLQAMELQRHLGDPRLDRFLRADLGEAYDLLNQARLAESCFERALEQSRLAVDRVTEARALFGLARTSLRANDLDTARTRIAQALSIAESLRTAVEHRDLRASYVASVYEYHELHMDVLLRLHQRHPDRGLAAEALAASERARARSLLDSLAESGIDLRADLDPDLLEREQAAARALEDWARRRRIAGAGAADSGIPSLASEYRDLEERYNQIQAEIRSRSPRYAALARPEPLTLEDIQRDVLDSDTLLLEYALGDRRSHVWVVSKDSHAVHDLAPRADIERAAEKVYTLLTARLATGGTARERSVAAERADEEYWREATHLSRLVLGPVAPALGRTRIVVVADGRLQYIPFSALPVPGKRGPPLPLLVEHEVVNLPSASVLAALRREAERRSRPSGTVAVFADPVYESDDPRLRALDLPDDFQAQDALLRRDDDRGLWTISRLASTRQEAGAILASAPGDTSLARTGFDASRATALGPDLARFRIVHFATHGVFDDDDPGQSGLVLSLYDRNGHPRDGFLRLRDVYTLRLPADLVVLSACNTALGRQLRGEGLVGIVRGFFYAGSERVVASLWKVDDEATSELMQRFYDQMLRQGRPPAEALRRAQLAMWRQSRWKAPFYWAAFVLQGEWR